MVGGKATFFLAGWWIGSLLSGGWLGGSESLAGFPACKSQDCSVGFSEVTLLYTGLILSGFFFPPFFT